VAAEEVVAEEVVPKAVVEAMPYVPVVLLQSFSCFSALLFLNPK
jgi:ABC-type microcin C transport system permease subunit YejE